MICAVCGRRTAPAYFIGSEAIGPACARKLGLTKKKVSAATGGSMRIAVGSAPAIPQRDKRTIDLFEG